MLYICHCLTPDKTRHKVNDPKVDYCGDLGEGREGEGTSRGSNPASHRPTRDRRICVNTHTLSFSLSLSYTHIHSYMSNRYVFISNIFINVCLIHICVYVSHAYIPTYIHTYIHTYVYILLLFSLYRELGV